MTCASPLCGHTDLVYAGIAPASDSLGTSSSDRAGGTNNGFPARKGQRGPGAAAAGHIAAKVSNGAPHFGEPAC